MFFTITFAPTLNAQGQLPPIIRDTEIEATFKEWMSPLLKASDIGTNSVDFVLVQSDQINAFVAGGANIFFYTGLIKKTDGPDEVVGVLAHEMGHIAGGHLISTQQALERASYESILGAVLGLGAAIATGNGELANAIIGGSQNVAIRRFLSHSRVHEASADQAAFSYLSRAGLNPSGLSSFFKKLENEELLPSSQQSEYMRTHPITRNRIEAVDALIAKSPLNDKAFPARWNDQHARMKAKLIGFINPEQVAWMYPKDDTSLPARYARTIAAYRLNDIPTALRGIDALLGEEPDNPYFHELKGQMLVEFSRVEEGLPSYRKAVELMPDGPLLRIALANALIQSDDPARLKDAITHLDRALVKEKRSTRVHRLLATAHGRLGHDSLAKMHLAEEALLQQRLPYAKAQAESALQGFKAGSPEWIKTKDVLNQIALMEQKMK
ncbi:MAG: M48 family metallopeptidase [Rhodospirillales bacterium]|nr:M48 family metallopeptidase [Rhodospirillales bacterium]